MSIKLVCDGCRKAEEYQQSYGGIMPTAPPEWACIIVNGPLVAVPAEEAPDKFKRQLLQSHINLAKPVIGPKQYLVCSAECVCRVCDVIQEYLEKSYRKRTTIRRKNEASS